jgi:hypothetical protein
MSWRAQNTGQKKGNMKTNYYNMKGSEILEHLEKHCNEKIQCSQRLRFQITQTLNRIVEDRNTLISKIDCVLKGFDVFDPSTQKVIHLSKK